MFFYNKCWKNLQINRKLRIILICILELCKLNLREHQGNIVIYSYIKYLYIIQS